MNKLDVIQMMAEYYGKDMSAGTIKVYVETLEDIPVDLLDMAAKHLIKTGHPFMPRVVELRQAAAAIKVKGDYIPEDPLKLIPGAAQTEADLDERYGTNEFWAGVCDVLEAGGEMPEEAQAWLS